MTNARAVTLQQRLVALKTGFEALLGKRKRNSSSRECARDLRQLFEDTTRPHVALLPWAGVLWSPAERTSLPRTNKEGKADPRSELEDWFMTLAEARNSVIHEGALSVDKYGPPPERPLSRYRGSLFWIGERLLREAIKARLGAEVLLCGRLAEAAQYDRLGEKVHAFVVQQGIAEEHADQGQAQETHGVEPSSRNLAALLDAMGCTAANEVELSMVAAGRSRTAWAAKAGPKKDADHLSGARRPGARRSGGVVP